MDNTIVLSTAYLPPVQYFTKFITGNRVWIENDENYTKQTYRNRCLVAGPNGILTLSVPVRRGSFHKTHLRDILIDYDTQWVDNHRRTLKTAYASSPYYEYYIIELMDIISKRPAFLLDLNTNLLDFLLGLVNIENNYTFTNTYISKPVASYLLDYRDRIVPKSPEKDPLFSAVPYEQVFKEKFGFLPNLSIVDLLFNTGPDAGAWLKRSLATTDNSQGNPEQ